MTQNIRKVCRKCEICIKNKSRGRDKIGLLSHLGPAKNPFEIVSIDTIGGFGGSRSTKKYLHLLVDHFTRYAYIHTSKTQTASDFIKLVEKVTDNNIGKGVQKLLNREIYTHNFHCRGYTILKWSK